MKETLQFYFNGFTIGFSIIGHVGCLVTNIYISYLLYTELTTQFWIKAFSDLKILIFILLGIFTLFTFARFFILNTKNFFLSLIFRLKMVVDFSLFVMLSINRFHVLLDEKNSFLNTASMISITISAFFDFWLSFLAEKLKKPDINIIPKLFIFSGLTMLVSELLYCFVISTLFLFRQLFLGFSLIVLSSSIIFMIFVFLVFRKVIFVKLPKPIDNSPNE